MTRRNETDDELHDRLVVEHLDDEAEAHEEHARRERPISTAFNVFWSAYFTHEYCGCGTCHPLIGHGKTETEAVANLLEQESER